MSDDGRSHNGETTGPLTLAELARAIGAELASPGPAGADTTILRCRALDAAGPGDVSFVSNPRYANQLQTTRASAVIVARRVSARARRQANDGAAQPRRRE